MARWRAAALGLGVWVWLSALPPARAVVLWSQPNPALIHTNGLGSDILHGAVAPRDDKSSDTLYFKFQVDPRSDIVNRLEPDRDYFLAGLCLYYRTTEKLGVGNAWDAWGYSAFAPSLNVTPNQPGEINLNSANAERMPETHGIHEVTRRSIKRTIVFKVDYIPRDQDLVTVWLSPDLTPGANEFLQKSNIVTRFKVDTSFDEIRLCHRGAGDGWVFNDIAVATRFEDFVPLPFWRRGWVIGFSFLLLGSGIASLIAVRMRGRSQQRIRQLEHQQAVARERSRIAQDLHDDLGVRLTEISLLAHIADNREAASEQLADALRQACKVARETSETTDGIVWSLDPHNDSLQSLADYLVQFAEEFFRKTTIRCRFEVPAALPEPPVSAPFRHHVLLAVKEMCHNAARHSGASEVWLRITVNTGNARIGIEDNGRGFELAVCAGQGNGLRNLSHRMAELGGSVEVSRPAGGGASVRLIVPLPGHK